MGKQDLNPGYEFMYIGTFENTSQIEVPQFARAIRTTQFNATDPSVGRRRRLLNTEDSAVGGGMSAFNFVESTMSSVMNPETIDEYAREQNLVQDEQIEKDKERIVKNSERITQNAVRIATNTKQLDNTNVNMGKVMEGMMATRTEMASTSTRMSVVAGEQANLAEDVNRLNEKTTNQFKKVSADLRAQRDAEALLTRTFLAATDDIKEQLRRAERQTVVQRQYTKRLVHMTANSRIMESVVTSDVTKKFFEVIEALQYAQEINKYEHVPRVTGAIHTFYFVRPAMHFDAQLMGTVCRMTAKEVLSPVRFLNENLKDQRYYLESVPRCYNFPTYKCFSKVCTDSRANGALSNTCTKHTFMAGDSVSGIRNKLHEIPMFAQGMLEDDCVTNGVFDIANCLNPYTIDAFNKNGGSVACYDPRRLWREMNAYSNPHPLRGKYTGLYSSLKCHSTNPCTEGGGSCQDDKECLGSLVCPSYNEDSCKSADTGWGTFTARCCTQVKTEKRCSVAEPTHPAKVAECIVEQTRNAFDNERERLDVTECEEKEYSDDNGKQITPCCDGSCVVGEGGCTQDAHCLGHFMCGYDNCPSWPVENDVYPNRCCYDPLDVNACQATADRKGQSCAAGSAGRVGDGFAIFQGFRRAQTGPAAPRREETLGLMGYDDDDDDDGNELDLSGLAGGQGYEGRGVYSKPPFNTAIESQDTISSYNKLNVYATLFFDPIELAGEHEKRRRTVDRARAAERSKDAETLTARFLKLWSSGQYGRNLASAVYGQFINVTIAKDCNTGRTVVLDEELFQFSSELLRFTAGDSALSGWGTSDMVWTKGGEENNKNDYQRIAYVPYAEGNPCVVVPLEVGDEEVGSFSHVCCRSNMYSNLTLSEKDRSLISNPDLTQLTPYLDERVSRGETRLLQQNSVLDSMIRDLNQMASDTTPLLSANSSLRGFSTYLANRTRQSQNMAARIQNETRATVTRLNVLKNESDSRVGAMKKQLDAFNLEVEIGANKSASLKAEADLLEAEAEELRNKYDNIPKPYFTGFAFGSDEDNVRVFGFVLLLISMFNLLALEFWYVGKIKCRNEKKRD
jgi:hypothetical protein